MGKIRIFMIEDEKKLLRTISDFLRIQGYKILCASDGSEALEIFKREHTALDLVLLDLSLPKVDGFTVLREIRKISDIPVIILSARSAVEEQINGFSLGADDYITKPFTLELAKMHIEAVLKRAGKLRKTLEYGKLCVELERQQAYWKEIPVELTRKEFELLVYFMEHPEVVLSRNVILDGVWGYEYVGDIRTVDTLVKQLRKKLTEECDYIRSVYGVGYLFGGCREEQTVPAESDGGKEKGKDE